jgi:hypothetical protein
MVQVERVDLLLFLQFRQQEVVGVALMQTDRMELVLLADLVAVAVWVTALAQVVMGTKVDIFR